MSVPSGSGSVTGSTAAGTGTGLIDRVIGFSIQNRAVVLALTVGLALLGVHAMARTPVDAIPDLSENQVIVFADWMGRSPREVEDQVTYPLSVALQGLAGVKAVRSTSEFNYSMINVIFEDDVGFYFARERVLERLTTSSTFLPAGVAPYLAPDATALGQIWWYTLEGGGLDPGQLRALQDWYVRYQLQAVPGVAGVAGVGGFVQEWQVDVDPTRLRALGVTLGEVFAAIGRSNLSVGGNVVVKGGAEYLVRGEGWLRGRADLELIVVAQRGGVPIYVKNVGTVQLGPEPRRAALEKDGTDAVGGVVLMRWGENPREVTARVEARVGALQAGLPPGVRLVPFYDRTPLIDAAIGTLTRTLLEEMIVASVMVLLVLRHLRSAFVICITLPLAVLASFVLMRAAGVTSNIMSLSGIAISIGVLLDAGIVMTENAYARLHERFGDRPVTGDTRPIVLEACRSVGRPLFFSVLIMLLSFLPVFALGGLEGRMFWPLALTKTFALVAVAVLAITVVPALLPTFVRGRLQSEQENWLLRSVIDVYKPTLSWLIDRPRLVWLSFAVMLGVGLNVAPKLGRVFMPPLDERSIMDMPVTTPSASVAEARDALLVRDGLLRELPEVARAVGKAGRADTPTDPSPVDMVETIVTLRPDEQWPRRHVPFEVFLRAARGGLGLGAAKGPDEREDEANGLAMEATTHFDAALRDLARTRIAEAVAVVGSAVAEGLVADLIPTAETLRRERFEPSGRPASMTTRSWVDDGWGPNSLHDDLQGASSTTFGDRRLANVDPPVKLAAFRVVREWAPRFADDVLPWEVASAAQGAAAKLAPSRAAELLAREPSPLDPLLDPLRSLVGRARPTRERGLFEAAVRRRDALLREQVRALDVELERQAPALVAAALAKASAARGQTVKLDFTAHVGEVTPRRKTKSELIDELNGYLQVPGWANIWTQPIINRVDMLATGVRTMIGVKVYGDDLDTVQRVAREVADALRAVPGAVDVVPDQVTGERYLEVTVDRERAARYGVDVQAIQDTVEVALGGKRITTTIDGRRRFGVRLRYPRDLRQDEQAVRRILVAGRAPGADMSGTGGGMTGSVPAAEPASGAEAPQVPLEEVATIRVVQGPSMIKSEDGRLRAYVQLNVRERDVVGFVEEAQRAVKEKVKEPPGVAFEWSGQFEHQVRARRTLALLVPIVLLIIFVLLYLTYQDLGDALLMMLAVPGALVGGVLFQWAFGFDFSVAVWIGYIACFGLATETGIIMLVYLREAIDRRGGLEAIPSVEALREAVIEGAVHRLRPKLLTEGTTLIGLVPMLMATGVGAEVMRPMAAPVLGGILIADEVIDVFIPVVFYWYRRARWERLHGRSA